MTTKILRLGIIILAILLVAGASLLFFLNRSALFSEDFSSGEASGFKIINGIWSVVDDGSGNKVLEGNGGQITFGPDLEDFNLKLRIKIIQGSDPVDIYFRKHLYEFYTLFIHPNESIVDLAFVTVNPPQPWSIEHIKVPVYTVKSGQWATVRIEAVDDQIKVFIDGFELINVTNSKLRNGIFGINCDNDSIVQIDDIIITHPGVYD